MKMGVHMELEDIGRILAEGRKLGGHVVFFKQSSEGGGYCGGWVARWIRKIVMDKEDWSPNDKGSLYDERYWVSGYLGRADIDGDSAVAKALAPAVLAARGGIVTQWETDEGTANAKSLMDIQEDARDEWKRVKGPLVKQLEALKSNMEVLRQFQDDKSDVTGVNAKIAKLESQIADLKRQTKDPNMPKWSGWMRKYITTGDRETKKAGALTTGDKETKKAGAPLVKYVRLEGNFTKGPIGENAEGLKKLHAGCDKKLVYVALREGSGRGGSGHAVGLHRLSKEGKTAFFDPNMGMVKLGSNLFDQWVEFYWKNSKYHFKSYQGKVFERVEMAGERLALAFQQRQQRGDTRQNRRGGQWRQ
jgi:hypothetical protein